MGDTHTEVRYSPEYQDGSAVRDDDTPGGTWYAAGDIHGYATLPEAEGAIEYVIGRGKHVTGTRIWKITTTQELI